MEKPFEPRIVSLPKIEDPRGNLSFAEKGTGVPFDIERVYWTYDIPSAADRHGRALRTCAEFIVATSGRCTVNTDCGDGRVRSFTLDRSNTGLYLPPMTWRSITGCVTGTTCVTMASKPYDENDYIRDYRLFTLSVADARP